MVSEIGKAIQIPLIPKNPGKIYNRGIITKLIRGNPKKLKNSQEFTNFLGFIKKGSFYRKVFDGLIVNNHHRVVIVKLLLGTMF